MATVNPENSKIYNTEDVISQAGKRVYYNEEKDDYYVQGEFDYPVKKVKFHIDTERSQWPEPEPEPPMELEPGQVIRENGTYGADDPDGNGTIDFTKEQNRSVTNTTNTLGTFVVNVPNGTETKSITSNGTYTPTAPNIGFSQVDVNVPIPSPNLQSKTEELSNVDQGSNTWISTDVTPDSGYDGLSSVRVRYRKINGSFDVEVRDTSYGPAMLGTYFTREYFAYTPPPDDNSVTAAQPVMRWKINPDLNPIYHYIGINSVTLNQQIQYKTITRNGTFYPANNYSLIKKIVVNVPVPQITFFYNNRENTGSPYTWYYNDTGSSLTPTKTGSWQNKSVWIISGHDIDYKYEYTFTYYHYCSDDFIKNLASHDYWCIIDNPISNYSQFLYSNQVNYSPIVSFAFNTNLLSRSDGSNQIFRGTISKKAAELALDSNYVTNYSNLP